MVGEQPTYARRRGIADLLVRLERHDDVALGHVALLLVADQVGDEGSGHELVVGGAAAVEVTVPLGELEGIESTSPRGLASTTSICASSRIGLRLPVPAQPRHQIALARSGHEHLHVRCGKTRGTQTRRHGLRGTRGVARGCDGVDLDELLVDVEGELLMRRAGLGTCRPEAREEHCACRE